MNDATKALLEKEIMEVERFDQIFGEQVREVLSYSRPELFEHNKGKLPFYPLEQLRDVVTEGDILIGTYEWADASNYFGIADYTLNEAILPVFKKTEPYVLIDGSYAPVRKLNSDNYIVVPKLRDFDKEFSKRAEIRKRLREIDQEIKALNKEHIALFNEL